MSDARKPHIAVIGAGPAGLMAAEVLSAGGAAVTVYERMPSVGRKLLIAGRGGLNLTHSEPFESFVARYSAAAERLRPMLEAFPPSALIAWANGLEQETFVGTSGRVFPKAMKASPLLRAWLARLAAQGVRIQTRATWTGWDSDALIFADGSRVRADATVLALGGASWAKLGSDGAWAALLAARGVEIAPFKPSNCGFTVAWSDVFVSKFEGEPLKGIALSFDGASARGEAVVTRAGIEGGAVYALSARLRDAIAAQGNATMQVDLRPEMSAAQVAAKLERPRGGQSLSNFLRKALALSPVAISLLREGHGALAGDAAGLARQIKAVPMTLTGVQAIDRAISTAGGVSFDAVDETLMLCAIPNTYVAGEMLDWEAPTGGYLLQASFATGYAVARAVLCRAQVPSA